MVTKTRGQNGLPYRHITDPSIRQAAENSFMVVGGRAIPLSEVRSEFAEPLRDTIRGGTGANIIDDFTASQLYAKCLTAWIAVNVRATMIAEVPLQVVFKADKTPIEGGHPISNFIARDSSFLWLIEVSLLLFGKCFLRKRRNARGYPTDIEYLNPADVQINYDSVRQRIVNYSVAGEPYAVPPSEMIYMRSWAADSDYEGLSRYEVAMRRLSVDDSLAQWAASFFLNGARPDGVLSFEGSITPQELEEHEKRWKKVFRGAANAFKTFIAGSMSGSKWSWTPIQAAPVDLALKDVKDDVRVDVCAVMEVHPALCGFSLAADPLGASNTLRELRNQHLDYVTSPRANWICEQLNEQWLSVDFGGDQLGGPIPPVMLQPDLSGITAVTRATLERANTVNVSLQSGAFTLDESREFLGRPPLPDAIQRNPTWALQIYQGGIAKRSIVQKAIGLEPDLLNDGYVYELDKSRSAASNPFGGGFPGLGGGGGLPQLGSGPGGGSGSGNPPQLNLPPGFNGASGNRALPGALRSAPSFYTILSLANDPALLAFMQSIKADYPGAAWTEPADLHITLAHSSLVPSDKVEAITAATPFDSALPTIQTSELSTFESGDGNPIPLILLVNLTDELASLQTAAANAFTSCDCPISEYSAEGNYTPHITLAYLPSGNDVKPTETALEIKPSGVVLSQDDHRVIAQSTPAIEITGRSVNFTSQQTAAELREIQQWRTVVKNKGYDAAFTTVHIRPERAEFIRRSLAEYWNEAAVFDAARQWARDGAEPQPFGVTPQVADLYWQRFDSIQEDFSDLVLEYFTAGGAALFDTVINHPHVTPDVTAGFEAARKQFIAKAIGTPDKPGPLAKFYIAGYAAGNDQLNGAVVQPPDKRDGPVVKWDLVNAEAYDHAVEYAMALVKNIDETTRNNLSELLQTSLKEGWPRQKLIDEISKVLPPPDSIIPMEVKDRAALITDNEKMVAYNTGSLERMKQARVNEAIWQTVRDSHVCRICRPLHGVKANINEGWLNTVTGRRYTTQAHIRCRCFRQPVVPKDYTPTAAQVTQAFNADSVYQKANMGFEVSKEQIADIIANPELLFKPKDRDLFGTNVKDAITIKRVGVPGAPLLLQDPANDVVRVYVNTVNPLSVYNVKELNAWKKKHNVGKNGVTFEQALKDAGHDSILIGSELIITDPSQLKIAQIGNGNTVNPVPNVTKIIQAANNSNPANIKQVAALKQNDLYKVDDQLAALNKKYNPPELDDIQAQSSALVKRINETDDNDEIKAIINQLADLDDKRIEIKKAAGAYGDIKADQAAIIGNGTTPARLNLTNPNVSAVYSEQKKERLISAQEWLKTVLNGDKYNLDINFKIKITPGRAGADRINQEIMLDPKDPPDVAIHEIGHTLEYHNPEIHARAVEFLLSRRAKDTEPERLSVLTNNPNYGDHEIAFKGNYPTAYVGKLYRGSDGQIRSTEVISMGLQYLYNDPIGFKQIDPDYYDFIISIVRGYL